MTEKLPIWRVETYKHLSFEEAKDRYADIFSQYLAPATQKGAGEDIKQVAWRLRRYLARNDLFYLLAFVLNRPDIMHPWLYARIREVEAEPNGCLDLWAREHYKSTIITFALTIQDILNNPEITVGLFSFSQDIASQFLRQIKQELETNTTLIQLFPDILYQNPTKSSPKWTEQAITVKRMGNPKEATIEAWGIIDAQPVSKHFSHRIYDDMVHERGVNTEKMIKKTTYKWELSDSLAKSDGHSGGIERYVGTIYHMHDTYSVMRSRGVVKARIHPCTSDGSTDFSKAVLLSPEVLQKKYNTQGSYTFGCQMLLNPKVDSVIGFDIKNLKFWEADTKTNLSVIIIVDPASRQNSTNDYTSMWVLGLGEDGKWRALDFLRDKLSLSGRTNFLFRFHRMYKPIYVFYEQYGASSDVDHMKHVMKEQNYDFADTLITLPCSLSEDPRTKTKFLDVVKSSRMSKPNRIMRLTPLFERGDIFIPKSIIRQNYQGDAEDFIKSFIEQEYSIYPTVSHDDALDCLAYICDPVVQILTPIPKTEIKFDSTEAMIRKIQNRNKRRVAV
jgi:phage terminase large subunit-like protein